MIPQQTINDVLQAADLVQVLSQFMTLKKAGVNYTGLCPFHNEKTPSFSVSPAKGIYKCFGCGASGNVVDFLMNHERMTFPMAIKFLASKYNISIPEDEFHKLNDERESLMAVCAWAKRFFSEKLQNNVTAMNYLSERGLFPETITKFQLGYAPGRNECMNKGVANGYRSEFLEKAGLIKRAEPDTPLYDVFQNRIMFPIHNALGHIIGFGGRTYKKDEHRAKYINSKETPLYRKSNIIYGLHLAYEAMQKTDTCILVEGYMDVIAMHQSHIYNTVASCGTSLTIEQIKQIQRYTNTLCIIYDADNAGNKATERGLKLAINEGMNVFTCKLPEGHDPDSFCKECNFNHDSVAGTIAGRITHVAYEETIDTINNRADYGQRYRQFSVAITQMESNLEHLKTKPGIPSNIISQQSQILTAIKEFEAICPPETKKTQA